MCEKSKVLKSCLVKCSFSRNRAGSPPLLFRLGLLVRPLQIIGSLSHRGWKRQHQGAQVDKLATVDNLKLWKKSSLPLWLDLQLYKERIIMRGSIKCTKPYMDPWYYFESTNVNLFCITGIKVGVQQESCSNHYSEQLSRWTPTLIPPLGPSGTPPLSLSSVIFSCDSLCLDGMMWKKASAETSGTLIHITSPSPVLLGWWWPCWRRIRWSPVGSLSGSPAE